MANTCASTLTATDPSHLPVAEQERLMRRGIRDAARVYKMHGVKMVVGDKNGNVREIDPDEVLRDLDEADKKAAG